MSVVVQKPWGYEEILIDEPDRCLKRLTLWPGCRTSKQRHWNKDETMVAIAGDPSLLVWDRDREHWDPEVVPLALRPARIVPGVAHRLSAGLTLAVVLEISGPRDDDDVVRLQDDYGRAGD